ncbi:Internal alternative NAD(P)H-ubiquinone oxidoreductase A2, mitochondrial [Linum perenne]
MAWFRTLTRLSTTVKSVPPPPIRAATGSPSLSHFFTTVATDEPYLSPSPTHYGILKPTTSGEKARIVVLGSRWAGCRLMKGIDTTIYNVMRFSPESHVTTEQEKSRLLHCVVVGGGPTEVEYSGELSDFDVESDKIILDNGTEVPYGLLVWSTGVGPSSLVKSLDLPKSPGGRIGIDGGYGYRMWSSGEKSVTGFLEAEGVDDGGIGGGRSNIPSSGILRPLELSITC